MAYAASLTVHRGKFDTRSVKSINLGFESSHKGYLLYDLTEDKTFTSRDLKFDVNKFPFATGNQNDNHVPLPMLPDLVSNLEVQSVVDGQVEPDCEGLESQQEQEVPIHHSQESNHQPLLRRSTKTVQPPIWMKDYVGCVHTEVLSPVPTGVHPPPIFSYFISPCFSESYIQYLFNMSTLYERVSYSEASQYPEWVDAMETELNALEANKT